MNQRVLVIQLRQLGDILLTTPLPREIKKDWPAATVDFLCHPMGEKILGGHPWIDELLTYDETSWTQQLALCQKLRQKRYTHVIDCMGNPRSALLAWISGAKVRVSFKTARQWFYTDTVIRGDGSLYVVEEKFNLLRTLALQPQDSSLILKWSEADEKPWREWQEKHLQDKSAKIVVLSPTHRRVLRQWPVEHFVVLADWLVQSLGAKAVWVYGPQEKEWVQDLQQQCRSATSLIPETTLKELAAFFSHCHLFIGNSNGPSHIAVAAGTPSIQLHGPTFATAWCPRGEKYIGLQGQQMADITLRNVQDAVAKLGFT